MVRRVSKEARDSSQARLRKAVELFDYQQGRKEIQKVKQRDIAKMREVIDFFYEVYPYPVHDSVKETLNELLLAKKGTKSVIGMINVIDNLVGWKDWRQKAYVRFHISL